MQLKKILLAALLFVCSFSYSQLTKTQSTSRMLKTATSLLEAQQFEAAEEYFKKGLQNAKAGNDFYNQALAYEGLGIFTPNLIRRNWLSAHTNRQ